MFTPVGRAHEKAEIGNRFAIFLGNRAFAHRQLARPRTVIVGRYTYILPTERVGQRPIAIVILDFHASDHGMDNAFLIILDLDL